MDKLTFVGMVLSANGISCAVDKVKAVTSAREPQNASETRGLLGLVNYCGRFIPDLATLSEPLRRLTKAGTPFVFGKEQKEAFAELKKRLSNSETLGYFDKDAPTQAIADTHKRRKRRSLSYGLVKSSTLTSMAFHSSS